MTQLFNDVNGRNGSGEDWSYSSPNNLRIPWTNVTKENGWRFGFFYRDPLARYVSAFGSKCLVNTQGVLEGGGKDCKGKVQWTPLSMEEMIAAFEERAMNDSAVGHPANNTHWHPMTKVLRACGMDKFHPKVADFKGNLDAEDGNVEVKKMFRVVGLEVDDLVDKHFPPERIQGHSSRTHGKVEQFYRNATVMLAVAKLYEEDYRRLKLPAPSVAHKMFNKSQPDDILSRLARKAAQHKKRH